jgi:hypothetical protein
MVISAKILAEIQYDISTGSDTEENHFENDEAFLDLVSRKCKFVFY